MGYRTVSSLPRHPFSPSSGFLQFLPPNPMITWEVEFQEANARELSSNTQTRSFSTSKGANLITLLASTGPWPDPAVNLQDRNSSMADPALS